MLKIKWEEEVLHWGGTYDRAPAPLQMAAVRAAVARYRGPHP